MKKIFVLLLSCLLTMVFASCSEQPTIQPTIPQTEQAANNNQTGNENNVLNEKASNSATLYAVFSNNASGIDEYSLDYQGELTIEMLAEGLSELTGLSFDINTTSIGNGVANVDWSTDSFLIAGLGEDPQKEEFFFYDNVSLNWFMMDSLYVTILNNFDVTEVYYTMNGLQQLIPTDMSGIEFPINSSYKGSDYYYTTSSANDPIEVSKALYKTAGIWHVDGDETTANLHMDGMGRYTAYYASGSLESEGYMLPVELLDGENYSFDLFTDNNDYFVTIYFSDDNNFYTDTQNYVKTHTFQVG